MSERKNYGRLRDVLPIPDLIKIQTKSFDDFLQLHVAPGKRENKGLQEVLTEMFNLDARDNGGGLEFKGYEVDEPRKSIVDCIRDGETYQAQIKGSFALTLPGRKEIDEASIPLVEMPLMTEKGSFVIAGVERVIVSQLHRSPGVCFEKIKQSGGRDLFGYKVVADHGSWMDVELDGKDYMYIYLDRRHRGRKFLISQFLRAFGYKNDRDLINAVYRYFYFDKTGRRLTIDPSYNDSHRNRLTPLFGALPKVISAGEEKLTSASLDTLPDWLGVEDISIDSLMGLSEDKLSRIYVVETIKSEDSDFELLERFSSLNPYVLEDIGKAGIKTLPVVDTTGMGDSFIRCIQKEYDEATTNGREVSPVDARKEIFRKLRPSDQPTENSARALFVHTFEESRRFDLGRVGRYRLFKRLNHSLLRDLDEMVSEDEKEYRANWGKISFAALRPALQYFERLTNELVEGGLHSLDEDYLLRLCFSTPERVLNEVFKPGKIKSGELDLGKIELSNFVKLVYPRFLEETVATGGVDKMVGAKSNVLSAFVKSCMSEAVEALRKACARVGLGAEKEDNRRIKEDASIIKRIEGELQSVLKMSTAAMRAMLDKDSVIPENGKKEDKAQLMVQAVVRELLKETIKEIVYQVQDYVKSRRYLTRADIAASTAYLMRLKSNCCSTDDIDHLGCRRLRTIGELLQNQCRAGMGKIIATFRERVSGPVAGSRGSTSLDNVKDLTVARVLNCKPLTTVIKDFFSRNPLSQFMDQTNVLAELTNKRRLSALGIGGLARERAGFEVRDVHASHYGRICPIETPEGPNIGLISSLALYAEIDEFGFINTPYREVQDGVVKDKIDYLPADREERFVIAQANAAQDEHGRFTKDYVWARKNGESNEYSSRAVNYIDVSPRQLISAATGLIPFLEHDDANRALMGSNMQRQAVPLLQADRPLVGTGLEAPVARYSRAVMSCEEDGIVVSSNAERVIVSKDGLDRDKTAYPESFRVYNLYKFMRSNAQTFINQHPIVKRGDKVVAGQALADGTSTDQGELALGRNVTVAFMSWHGYNFEDAIIISERLVMNDVYTSIHVTQVEATVRESKLGPDEITRDIPNISEYALRHLDPEGIIRIGSEVHPGDVLVGKITPKGEDDDSAVKRLWKNLFQDKAKNVKNTSLVVPVGIHGVVMDVRVKRKPVSEDGEEVKGDYRKIREREIETEYKQKHDAIIDEMVRMLSDSFLGQKLTCSIQRQVAGEPEELIAADRKITKSMLNKLALNFDSYMMRDCEDKVKIDDIIKGYRANLRNNERCRKEALEQLSKSETGKWGKVREVKVLIASKRKISVGDKMAGRHGNKGIVAKIVPVEDMPFMADGTPVDIILNPLGVPSRMNIGQVFETHVGWAAKILGMTVATPVFDGIQQETVVKMLADARAVKVKERGWKIDKEGIVRDEANRNRNECFVDVDGKTRLFDGRSGAPFAQRIMVGQVYMLKLDHLVANKIHARATGTYSLITQQPLGGKAQHGGQRVGEMEVWALEAYGAAYTLQEMLTVKSDDINGRRRTYASITNGDYTLHAGTPESFNVLKRELMGLCLDIRIPEKHR